MESPVQLIVVVGIAAGFLLPVGIWIESPAQLIVVVGIAAGFLLPIVIGISIGIWFFSGRSQKNQDDRDKPG